MDIQCQSSVEETGYQAKLSVSIRRLRAYILVPNVPALLFWYRSNNFRDEWLASNVVYWAMIIDI